MTNDKVFARFGLRQRNEDIHRYEFEWAVHREEVEMLLQFYEFPKDLCAGFVIKHGIEYVVGHELVLKFACHRVKHLNYTRMASKTGVIGNE